MLTNFLSRIQSWRSRRARLAALLFGILSAFALPPFNAVPLLLLTMPALLALIGSRARMRDAAWVGFFFGFGLHLVGLYWITDAILVVAATFWWLVPIAVPLLAAVLAVFIALPVALAWRARPGLPRVLALCGGWVLADLARQFVLTGFPWNPLGSVWVFPGGLGTAMLQPAALVGVHGLTLLTLLIACTPALGRRAMAAGALGLVAWAGFGFWRLSLPSPAAPDLSVILVQGNVSEGELWSRARQLAIFDRYLSLTRKAVAAAQGHPVVVVWPETASPFLLQTDPGARDAVSRAAMGAPVLAGSIRFGSDNRPRNSLIALAPDGHVAGVYDKTHLVPFGEYQPDWALIPIELVPGGGFAKGTGRETLHIPGLPPVGPLICYEAIFPAEVVDTSDRPDWLVNITNDAWFGNSTGPRQHLAAARLRAVEEGLPLMRAANTGISAGFDAFGREQGRLGIDVDGTLTIPLAGHLPPPPFARWGLVIPGLLALCAFALGFLGERVPRMQSRPKFLSRF